jgi:hypothetical protein
MNLALRLLIIFVSAFLLTAGVYQNNAGSGIDAELEFTLDFGGSGFDTVIDVAVGADGTIHLVGNTSSTDFPTVNPAQASLGGGIALPFDAFVARYDLSTEAFVFSTYQGGFGFEEAHGIAVDADGNSYVVGSTDAADFPTLNAVQPALQGSRDGFVASYDPDGNLRWSTFLGGDGSDNLWAVALDAEGNVTVVGETEGFSFVNPLQDMGGSVDAFIAKLTPAGDQILLATPIGGSNIDRARDLDFDAAGNLWVTGETLSDNFPIKGGLPSDVARGSSEVFVMKFPSPVDDIELSTVFGGSDADEPRALEVDGQGRPHVVGITWSDDFPTENPTQPSHGGQSDAFLTVLNAPADALRFSTYLGSDEGDEAWDLAVLADSLINVVGQTFSPGFPDNVDPLVPSLGVTPRSFVTTFELAAGGNPSIFFSSTVPGAERLNGVAPTSNGALALGGFSRSGVSPAGKSSGNLALGDDNGFVSILEFFGRDEPDLKITKTLSKDSPGEDIRVGDVLTYEITIWNEGGPATDVTVTDEIDDDAEARLIGSEPAGKASFARRTTLTGKEYSVVTEVMWVIPLLDTGEQRTFTVVVAATEATSELDNDARATSGEFASNVASIMGEVEESLAELLLFLPLVVNSSGKSTELIDVYLEGERVIDDLSANSGVRSVDSLGTILPVLDVVDASANDNSDPISSATIEWFTEPDSLFLFSEQTIFLIASGGDSLLPLVLPHARFESLDPSMVDLTIVQAAEGAGAVDFAVSRTGSASGVEFGDFTEYWSAAPGLVSVELHRTSDGVRLGVWEFDLGDRAGEAVTLFVEPADGTGKSSTSEHINMAGFDAQGNRFEALAATSADAESPEDFQLNIQPNYPNPVYGSTRFSFQIDAPSPVEILIYDALGRLVDRVDEGLKAAGEHFVIYDATKLSPGTYFYRLETGGPSDSGKMTVTR